MILTKMTAPIEYANKQLERLAKICKFEHLECYAIADNGHTAPKFDELFISFDNQYYINIYAMFNVVHISTNHTSSVRYGEGTILKSYNFKDFDKMTHEQIVKILHEVWEQSKLFCETEKLAPYNTKRHANYYEVSTWEQENGNKN